MQVVVFRVAEKRLDGAIETLAITQYIMNITIHSVSVLDFHINPIELDSARGLMVAIPEVLLFALGKVEPDFLPFQCLSIDILIFWLLQVVFQGVSW